MEGMDLLRMMGALLLLLGALVCALWLVRKFNLVPGAVQRGSYNRMEVVERLGIDQKRSAILLRLDDKEHLVVLSPEGLINVATVEHAGREMKPSKAERHEAEGQPSFPALLGDVARHAGLVRPKGEQGA